MVTADWILRQIKGSTSRHESVPFEFGIGSEFGFENPLRFFGLLMQARKPISARCGIRSVSVDVALPAQKSRYKSSTYCQGSTLSELLIIGRSKADGGPDQVLLGHHLIDFYAFSIEESVRLYGGSVLPMVGGSLTLQFTRPTLATRRWRHQLFQVRRFRRMSGWFVAQSGDRNRAALCAAVDPMVRPRDFGPVD